MIIEEEFSSRFRKNIFSEYAHHKFDSELENVLLNEGIEICLNFDKTRIQESWSWRNVHIARQLASLLIDEKGDLNRRALAKAIGILKSSLFSLGPGRHHDDKRQQHLLKILTLFYENPEFTTALKRIQLPESNPLADQLIKETLNLPQSMFTSLSHARIAAFSALLTTLRQNVGSCFATAPAILIHEHIPLRFLADIAQLFGMGKLSRTYGGVEYTVPLSSNWGMGDLFRPFLLSDLGDDPLFVLSSSPGLIAAFLEAGCISDSDVNEEKRKQCEKLLKKTNLVSHREAFQILTSMDIIEKVLLDFFKIKTSDLKSYLERSVEGPFGELVLQMPLGRDMKIQSTARYLKAIDAAKRAFKSVSDNALLKAWEFTLASFAEAKADFAKWNLYISLGVASEEPHGIGRTLYEEIQQRIAEINRELEDFQSKYEHLFAQAKYLEGRMRRAESEKDAGWIRADYEIRRREIDKILDDRDQIYDSGRKLSDLYSFLITFYGEKIPEYFQEVYDAEMHDVSQNPYDDSPAGFRLLYKHGRANPSLWTLVHSSTEYIQCLTSFFNATEVELTHRPETENIEKELSHLITSVISTIKRPDFLEASFYRLSKAYNEPIVKNPLENLDKVKRKPWSYVSGGTMGTLVSCYFGNEKLPDEAKRWVESESELLTFLIDSMKELPSSVQKLFLENQELPMLSFSPTHAFLLKPGWDFFRTAWENKEYTYTWIRDQWIFPQLRFLDEHILSIPMMNILVDLLLKFIPLGYREMAKNALNHFLHPLHASEFRERVLHSLSYERWVKTKQLELIGEEIDSLLFQTLPFFPSYSLKERLKKIFSEIEEIDENMRVKIFAQFEKIEDSLGKIAILSARDLKNFAMAAIMHAIQNTRSSIRWHQKITEVMQKLKFAYPKPMLIADSNWVKNVFGFVVNPGTKKVEFWRFDDSGSEGRPIEIWKRYLNGTDPHEWGIYLSPRQYGLFG